MQIQKPADLARIVKTQRQSQGLTQQDVADAVGITRQSLARIEQGRGGASFDTVVRVFEKLGVRLDATVNGQRRVVDQVLDNAGFRRVVPSASWRLRDGDASAVAAAALRHIDISALTAAARQSVDTSAIVAAATPSIDTSTLLSAWRGNLDNLTRQLRGTVLESGIELDGKEAREALLNLAIESGDPDSENSTVAGRSSSQEAPEEVGDA